MSDREGAWEVMSRAMDDFENMELSEFVQARGIMAPFLAFSLVVVSGILSIGEAIRAPVVAFVSGLGSIVDATFYEAVAIITAGAQNAAESFTTGTASLFGPATFPLAIVTVMAGLWVLAWFWQRVEWNPFGWLLNRF